MAKRKNKQRRREPRISAEDRAAADAVVEVARTLTCPVSVAGAYAAYCLDTADQHAGRANVAELARELYARPGVIEVELSVLLDDFVELARAHAEQLAELADRFEALTDHDIEHAHIEPEDLPIDAIATAMFGPPIDDEQEQAP